MIRGVTLLLTMFLALTVSAKNDSLQTKLAEKITEAKAFCESNNLNLKYSILIDMSIHSGKSRLFVVDFEDESVIETGLCSHGCCNSAWGDDCTAETPVFSNVPESHCSSIGKYKIGERGYSSWGINVNYKLHGLETTNSNAYDRFIVLHSWDMVPEYELYPEGTPEGWGCPAISNEKMKYIDSLIRSLKTPVLLWIFD